MDEDIAHLAHLARIKLSEDEKTAFKKNLEQILTYVEQVAEVDTEGVLPCDSVIETLKNVMGEDKPGSPLDHEIFLKNAPDQVGGMIKVPPIIEFEE